MKHILPLFAILGLIIRPAPGAQGVLHTTAELNAVLNQPSGNIMYFELKGILQERCNDRLYLISDATGGSLVIINSDKQPNIGDAVRLVGTAEWESTNMLRWPFVRGLTVTGQGSVAAPVEANIEGILSGQFDYRKIRLVGTVIDASVDEIDPQFCQIVIGNNGKSTTISLANDAETAPWLKGLMNAQVAAVGVCNPNAGYFRLFHTHSILAKRQDITVLVSPPKDPFAASPMGNIRHVNPQRIAEIQERRSVDGTIVAVWHGDRFLMKDNQGCVVQVILAGGVKPPKAGNYIRAVGIPETDLFHLNLSSAIWRPETGTPASPDEPEPISVKKLLVDDNGNMRIDPSRHGHVLRIHGLVRSVPTAGFGDEILHLEDEHFTIPVDFSSNTDALSGIVIGSKIEVTGTCILETDNWRPGVPFPRAKGLRLVIRQASDVRLLSKPSWWTPGRLMAVISALFAALVGIFIWNISLRRIAERRGRELFKAEIGKVGAELRVDERTRLAVDLHDSLAQNLTAISFQVASAISAKEVAPAATAVHLQNADRMLQSCRTELRRCLWDLRSDMLEEKDFSRAVEKTVEPVLGDAVLHVRFNIPRPHVSDTTTHAVLNIIRELVSNAVRHGQARHIWVVGELAQRQLRFSVRDNGCGFNVNDHPGQDTGHFGLKGINERLHPLDGTLELSSSESGTRAVVTIHLSRGEKSNL